MNGRTGDMTPEEVAYCAAYMRTGGKASKAYREAFPDRVVGLDSHGVANAAKAILRRNKVKAYLATVSAHMDRHIEEAYEITVERIGEEMASIGFADPKDVLDGKGHVLPLDQIPARLRAAISSFDIEVVLDAEGRMTMERVVKVRMWDKNTALGLLAKWKKMLVDRKEVGGPGAFDGMTDEEIEAELASLEARDVITRARGAATKAAMSAKSHPGKAGRPPDNHGRKRSASSSGA